MSKADAGKFLLQLVDLDEDGVQDLFLAADSTCGSRGCEFEIYRAVDPEQRCFEHLGGFDGHFGALKTRSNGFLDLKVVARDGALGGDSESIYRYEPSSKTYSSARGGAGP
jgi:hypothetical protein